MTKKQAEPYDGLRADMDEATKTKLDLIKAEGLIRMKELAERTYEVYKQSVKLMELDAKYKFLSGKHRKKVLLGIPAQAVMDMTDRWLINLETHNPEIMAKTKIPSKAERAKDRVEGRKVMYKDTKE